MKLIVGLGNPGKYYAHNRHNIGFRCLAYFAKLQSIKFERKQCRARIGIGELASEKLLLAKPMNFINLSGEAVGCLVRRYDIAMSNLIVVCDDLDLPLGKVRLRSGGGSGGHKGMKSIITTLGSEDFSRIRVGIGRPQVEGIPNNNEDIIVNYVLSDFLPREEAAIKLAIARVVEAIDCFLVQGIDTAMSRFN